MSENDWIQCLKKESFFGIISCLLLFVLALITLNVYSFDPLDRNLIINEQATYLTSNYTDVKKIVSVPKFLEEVDEIFQRELEMRRGTRNSFVSDRLKYNQILDISSNRDQNRTM